MTTALIIGSGAAAAGAALALSHRESLEITVVDIGLQLEDDHEQPAEALASKRPAASRDSRVPQKRVFGSDYPFRNVGQLDGLTAVNGAAAPLISPAYGGFTLRA